MNQDSSLLGMEEREREKERVSEREKERKKKNFEGMNEDMNAKTRIYETDSQITSQVAESVHQVSKHISASLSFCFYVVILSLSLLHPVTSIRSDEDGKEKQGLIVKRLNRIHSSRNPPLSFL